MPSGLQVAVSTWTFRTQPLFAALDILHLLGVTAVELWGDRAHLDPRLGLPDPEEIGAALDRLGLTLHSVHGPFRGMDLAADDETQRAEAVALVGQALEYAARLDCRRVVVHPSTGIPFDSETRRAAAWRRTVASFGELARRAGQLGVTVLIENLPDSTGRVIGGRVADLLALIEEVASPHLAVCLDVGHALVSTGGWQEEVAAAFPYLRSVHASDGDGSADAHLPLGDGTVPWDELLRTLVERGYEGGFVLEVGGGEDGIRRSLTVVERRRTG